MNQPARFTPPPEPPGDITTIWRDGTVVRQTHHGRTIALQPVAPLPESDPITLGITPPKDVT